MIYARSGVIGALFLLGVAAACGSGDTADAPTSTSGGTSPTPTSSSAPPSSPVMGPSTDGDGGVAADASLGDSPARCGATPYTWVKSSALGDVLETKSETGHTPVELNIALVS